MSGPGKAGLGLDADAKQRLLGRLAGRAPVERPAAEAEATPRLPLGDADLWRETLLSRQIGTRIGVESPFFRLYEGRGGPEAVVEGRIVVNFASYDYLGLNEHPRVLAAAKAAIDLYGVSVSGSRITSGERPVHRALEHALAEVYRADDCVAFVSGHATNVTVIGHLVGAEDAVIHDALAHNSIVQGAVLSGARRRSVAHNDLDELERALRELRGHARRTLVVVEGCYSMDGDVPDLPRLIPLVRRYGAHLMVDEAHALGVLGPRGFGAAEHFDIDPRLVDVWMGTLSKTLAGCGGYIAGDGQMVDYLRCSAPGFLYSVGMPAPVAAAAHAALQVMREEPERVARLQANGRLFLDALQASGLDTGAAIGAAVIPVVIGSSLRAVLAADALWKAGVQVMPIYYPGVPERTARLRFFVTAQHAPEQLSHTARAVAETLAGISIDPGLIPELASKLGQPKPDVP